MSPTPQKIKADEPETVHPDNLLDEIAPEATAMAPEASGGEVEPSSEPGSLPAVPDKGTAVEITSTALRAFVDDEWAGYDDDDGGLLNWQHVGFSIPRIVSDMRPGGGWTDEVTEKLVDQLDVIVVAAMPNRALFTHKFGKGDGIPACRSNDMLRADPSSPAMQAGWVPPDRDDADVAWFGTPTGTCATCPASMWNGDEPPACGERINMLVYLPETGEIRRMAVGGTSTKHFRKYASALRARAGTKPIYAQVTVMTLEPVEKDGMRWLEAHFAAGEPVSPREAATTIRPLKDQLVEHWRSLLAEALASGESDGTAVARGDAIDVEAREQYADEEPF